MWKRVWPVDSAQQTFVKVAVDSAGSVHGGLGYLLPVQAFGKTMDRGGRKDTTLIITGVLCTRGWVGTMQVWDVCPV